MPTVLLSAGRLSSLPVLGCCRCFMANSTGAVCSVQFVYCMSWILRFVIVAVNTHCNIYCYTPPTPNLWAKKYPPKRVDQEVMMTNEKAMLMWKLVSTRVVEDKIGCGPESRQSFLGLSLVANLRKGFRLQFGTWLLLEVCWGGNQWRPSTRREES